MKEYQDDETKTTWRYYLSEKECKGKTLYYINFTYPVKLKAKTESIDVYNKLQSHNIDELKSKLNSAIKSKYISKLVDSFNTKFKLFVFHKILLDKEFDKYFNNEISNISEDFNNFEITLELANVFSSQYYQKDEKEDVTYNFSNNEYTKNVGEITKALFAYDNSIGEKAYNKSYVFDMTNDEYRKKYITDNNINKCLYDELKEVYLNVENKSFSFNYFKLLISNTKCSYCGIGVEQIEELGKNGKLNNKRSETRGYSLEIDRKLPNLEYFKENCCMACYWCNNAKTDEFSPKDFKPIANGITNMWNNRLQKAGNTDKIKFDDKSTLWDIDF